MPTPDFYSHSMGKKRFAHSPSYVFFDIVVMIIRDLFLFCGRCMQWMDPFETGDQL